MTIFLAEIILFWSLSSPAKATSSPETSCAAFLARDSTAVPFCSCLNCCLPQAFTVLTRSSVSTIYLGCRPNIYQYDIDAAYRIICLSSLKYLSTSSFLCDRHGKAFAGVSRRGCFPFPSAIKLDNVPREALQTFGRENVHTMRIVLFFQVIYSQTATLAGADTNSH